jgi:Flp pilus assembly protein TadG
MSSSPKHTPRGWLRRAGLARDESGSIAVEFALICPVLILFVGGIIEGGLLLYTWGNMEHLGRQAARAVAVGAASNAQAETFVESKMTSSIGAMAVNATVTTSAGATAFENAVTVTVTITSAELAKILPFGIFSLTSLQSTVSLRLET